MPAKPERLRLVIIFGGRSVEHEVSVVSAIHVLAAADPERFDIIPVGVTKTGAWLSPDETRRQLALPEPPFQKSMLPEASDDSLLSAVDLALEGCDVVFPLIHGCQGEDGVVQGLLELVGLPYVGCGVAASALGMDKALMKAAMKEAGLEVARHRVLSSTGKESDALIQARSLEEDLGLPLFVKPARGGSSVGIHKAHSREELAAALLDARTYDPKLVVEAQVEGRELECGVLGNRQADASAVGEVRFEREFYDYEAKYLDPRSQVIAPAELDPAIAERVRQLAVQAFTAIDGSGMSRVDFFLRPDGSLVLDEINTIPGFTPASMFPRLWQALGVSYTELITRLVELALTRHREKLIV